MATQSEAEFYKKFFEFADRGDEDGARKFLTANISQLPQEVQDKVVMAFFEEAIAKKDRNDAAIAAFQKQGIQIMHDVGEAKEEAGKKLKMLEIKESL